MKRTYILFILPIIISGCGGSINDDGNEQQADRATPQSPTATFTLVPTSTNTPEPTDTPAPTFTPTISCGKYEEWIVTPPFEIKAPWPAGTTWIAGEYIKNGEVKGGNFYCGGKHKNEDRYALDFTAYDNTNENELVLAIADGVLYIDDDIKMENELGKYVILIHGPGPFGEYCYISLYAHLKVNCMPDENCNQRWGDNITQGEAIGRVGSTGNSTGPHLHFVMRRIEINEGFACNVQSIIDMKEDDWDDWEPVRPEPLGNVSPLYSGTSITSDNCIVNGGNQED